MKINEVKIKKLVEIANKNWGCYRKNKDPMIGTILGMFLDNDGTYTGNTKARTIKAIEIWNPFVRDRTTNKSKPIGLYTLTKKEWIRLEKSGFIQEMKNIDAGKYDDERFVKIIKKLMR